MKVHTRNLTELKIDDVASCTTQCQCLRTRKSFLKFNYGNNCLKVVLVTYKQFCSLKWWCVCYKIDYDNNAHVKICSHVAHWDVVMLSLTLYLEWICSSEHFWDNKLFLIIVFYQNILCFQGTLSRYRIANLKLSITVLVNHHLHLCRRHQSYLECCMPKD